MKKICLIVLCSITFFACSHESARVSPKSPPPYLCIEDETTRMSVAGGVGLAILGSAWYAPGLFVVAAATTAISSLVTLTTDYDHSLEQKVCDLA